MSEHRVKFYSEYDMASGWHLQKIEKLLDNWDANNEERTINDILELYNVKRYFDAGLRLENWDAESTDNYKRIVKQIPSIIGKFCAALSDENLIPLYKETDREYRDDFWKMLSDYKSYMRITPAVIGELFGEMPSAVWSVLHHKDIVQHFGQVVADQLVSNKLSAEWLISHFLTERENEKKDMHFPKEFSQELRTQVLSNYIEQENPNSNYLQILANAQSTAEFPLDDRLRLKARKKYEAMRDKLFSDRTGMSYGVEVSFKSIPDGSVEESMSDNICRSAYSREWIEENQDYPTLLNNFIYLFGYVDRAGRCSFVSLKNEMGTLERVMGLHGKKDYIYGMAFNVKNMQSTLQMEAYRYEIQRYGIKIEDLVKWFFETYLKEEFGAEGFSYSPPSEGTTYAEKCKLTAIAIDGILKQYRLYSEDGYVNRELLEMSSGHVVFSDLKSLGQNKYAYIASDAFTKEAFLFYSDQSLMTYTERTESKYDMLPQMLLKENLTVDDFQRYQQGNLQWLIDRGAVLIGEDGRLSVDKFRALVLRDLYKNEVLCPHCFDAELCKQIDEFVTAGDLKYENTLFSKPEQDYLNYMLNKSEFSNGLDLRNKYSHDTCSLDEKIQIHDYLELLKILVLIVIKINDEFCRNRSKS